MQTTEKYTTKQTRVKMPFHPNLPPNPTSTVLEPLTFSCSSISLASLALREFSFLLSRLGIMSSSCFSSFISCFCFSRNIFTSFSCHQGSKIPSSDTVLLNTILLYLSHVHLPHKCMRTYTHTYVHTHTQTHMNTPNTYGAHAPPPPPHVWCAHARAHTHTHFQMKKEMT